MSRIARAQAYPSKQINIIVPVPPGGLVDLVARAVGERLAEVWGQTVIVENKAGGNFQIATSYVAKAAPDGYTLLLAMDAPFVINPHLYTKLSYDPIADFAPITSLVRFDLVLAAHPSLPVDSVRDLIALAKKRPGELNYATFGLGSTANLYMKMFESMTGVKLAPVHYKGVAPMITDVVAGHVPMMFVTVGQTLPLWKDGKLKVLGVGTRERVRLFPTHPPFMKASYRDWKQTRGSVSTRREEQHGTSSARSMPKPGVLSPHPRSRKGPRAIFWRADDQFPRGIRPLYQIGI